jgi:hypothetical protein
VVLRQEQRETDVEDTKPSRQLRVCGITAAGTDPTTMPLSDESRVAAQPLLKDCDISTPDALRKEEVEIDALRALEDGSESGSEFEALKLQRRPGFWTRLRMSIRRRRHVESQRFGSERHHPGEPKSRRRRKRSCCLLVILVIGFFL